MLNLCIYLDFRFLHFSPPLLPLPVFSSFCFVPRCASPPPLFLLCLPLTDSADNDLELSMVRHQPEGLDQLQAQTQFTRKELQSLYRGFKNVCLLLLLGVVRKPKKTKQITPWNDELSVVHSCLLLMSTVGCARRTRCFTLLLLSDATATAALNQKTKRFKCKGPFVPSCGTILHCSHTRTHGWKEKKSF